MFNSAFQEGKKKLQAAQAAEFASSLSEEEEEKGRRRSIGKGVKGKGRASESDSDMDGMASAEQQMETFRQASQITLEDEPEEKYVLVLSSLDLPSLTTVPSLRHHFEIDERVFVRVQKKWWGAFIIDPSPLEIKGQPKYRCRTATGRYWVFEKDIRSLDRLYKIDEEVSVLCL